MAPLTSTRWLLVPAAVVVAIALVALAAGGLDRGAAPEPGTPEAVVGEFVQALAARDIEGVRGTLSSRLRADCSAEELRSQTRHRRDTGQRVRLGATEDLGDSVEVEVTRTRYGGEPPFGDSGYETTEVFALERDDGRWVITEVPWGFGVCGGWSR
jgi:hypothetical protein